MSLTVRLLCLVVVLASVVRNAHASEPAPDLDDIWDDTPSTMFVRGDTLHFYGEISKADVAPLRSLLQHASSGLARLEIASPGGEALSSIAIGEMIRALDLEVVVVGKGCNSSCANYIFTPARRRTISSGSLVLWHNSCPSRLPADAFRLKKMMLTPQDTASIAVDLKDDEGNPVTDPQKIKEHIEGSIEELVEYVSDYHAGHQRIFAGTQIDDRLICLADHLELPDGPEDGVGYSYTLSPEEMVRFGVCGVDAPEDYVQRAEAYFAARRTPGTSGGVVHLSDHPEFQPRYGVGHCRYRPSASADDGWRALHAAPGMRSEAGPHPSK